MIRQVKKVPDPLQQGVPTLRHQVRERLRQQIHGGQWRAGDRLPSEAELMHAHSVSRITVRLALGDLAAEGLIARAQGKGSFVAPSAIRQDLSRLQGLAEALESQGRSVRTRILSLRRHRPAASIARALELPPDAACMLLHTLRYVDDQPLSENHTWIRPEVAQGLRETDVMQSDLLTLYERDKGIRLARASVDIQAALANRTQCLRLELAHPAALLRVERTLYTVENQPVHLERSIYHQKAFSYRLTLAR